MKKKVIGRILLAAYRYFLFFLTVAFLVTCCMSLFVSTFSKDMELVLTGENLNRAAKLTFANVVLLSALFTAVDVIRRKLTTERITRRITQACRRLMQGDFTARIAPLPALAADENYTQIVECINTVAQELQSVETLRTDFVANVSHEMKTPLAVLQNYASLLQTPGLSETERAQYTQGILDGTRRLNDMMTNVLRLNRLENQQIYPEPVTFDLGEQLCECILPYENEWERKNISLTTDLAENILVHADKELMSLVWNNLFSNAFKFTPSGGSVHIRLEGTAETATVTVQDTGCGMSAQVGAHIFEKFYQGDTSHTAQGNGLGLALVKRVMDIVHGEISVFSTVGEGTAFTVKIKRM